MINCINFKPRRRIWVPNKKFIREEAARLVVLLRQECHRAATEACLEAQIQGFIYGSAEVPLSIEYTNLS